jgi:hypothetical protein
MKHLKILLFTSILFLFITPSQVKAEKNSEQKQANSASSAHASALISRLHQISNMDKKSLNMHEKGDLRTEVKSIQSQLKNLDGGVYLSVGAIIIILLLLILLL